MVALPLLIVLFIIILVLLLKPLYKVEKEALDLSGKITDDDNGNIFMLEQFLITYKREVQNQKDKDVLQKQAELNVLQNQINPHFLYNTLESIRGKALAQGDHEIALMTESLSSIFRYSISTGEDIVTLGEEIKNIESYFKIQQFRFDDRINLILDISEEDKDTCLMPKLTLQPLVENAIYHGLEQKLTGGEIRISLKKTSYNYIIKISDNGVGVKEGSLWEIQDKIKNISRSSLESRSGSGIALVNANSRIKLMFGETYGLSFYSTLGQGTDVEIILPSGEIQYE